MSAQDAKGFLPKARFAKKQRINFLLTVVTPIALMLALPIFLPEVDWLNAKSLIIFLVMWYLTGCLGISIGFHRYFAHRSFRTGRKMKMALAVLGLAAAQGPLTYWVALHRHHHSSSDEIGDIHSPHSAMSSRQGSAYFRRWLQSHLLWIWSHDIPSAKRYAIDVLVDEDLKALDKFYWPILIAGILIPGLLTYAISRTVDSFVLGVYWGGFARIVIGQNIIWSINSFCHLMGKTPHANGDRSSNIAALALPSWGESWHNNHHHDPTSARLGTASWQIDIGYETIRLLRKIGLVRPRRNAKTLV